MREGRSVEGRGSGYHLITLMIFEKSSVQGLAPGFETSGFQRGSLSRKPRSCWRLAIATHSAAVAPWAASFAEG